MTLWNQSQLIGFWLDFDWISNQSFNRLVVSHYCNRVGKINHDDKKQNESKHAPSSMTKYADNALKCWKTRRVSSKDKQSIRHRQVDKSLNTLYWLILGAMWHLEITDVYYLNFCVINTSPAISQYSSIAKKDRLCTYKTM